MLSNKDLTAISGIIKEQFREQFKEQFREQFKEQFKEGIKGVESRLSNLETDVKNVKDGLDRVDNRLDSLETDVKDVKDRVDRIETDVKDVKDRVDRIETDVKIIKIDSLENRVIPRLNTIEGYYVDASKKYIASADRFEAAISDIDVMKQTIKNHSIAIQELQMKQA